MTVTPTELADDVIGRLADRASDETISASQLAAVSSELRHWLDRTDPGPPGPDTVMRAATALLEHSRSGGRRQAAATLVELLGGDV